MSQPPITIAIIGAGLGGLTLALTLHHLGVQCTIYESRAEHKRSGGALMLAPNAQRIWVALGILVRFAQRGFSVENMPLRSPKHEHLGQIYYGGKEFYGYQALRIDRRIVNDELRLAAKERGIPLLYEKKFAGIVREDDSGVVFAFSDGTTASADYVIGADGIHSAVRETYVAPDTRAIYAQRVAVTSYVYRSNLQLPTSDYVFPTAFSCPSGSFIMIPESADGHQIQLGSENFTPERTPAEWAALQNDPPALKEVFARGRDNLNPLITSAVTKALEHPERLHLWPYYTLPPLAHWLSQLHGRVVLLGDAAHAIPPFGGQGACQATEDGWTLAHVLHSIIKPTDTNSQDTNALSRGPHALLTQWQTERQARIARILSFTLVAGTLRLSPEERAQHPALSDAETTAEMVRSLTVPGECAWLYRPEMVGLP